MNARDLDLVLVPLGLLILGGYHAWLLRRVLKQPAATVIGINAINRRIWVHAMMEDSAKTGVLAVQSLRNNIMASTLMASTAIMLCSMVAVLVTSGGGSPAALGAGRETITGGENVHPWLTVKIFAILCSFLLAFLFEVQSVRYYSHASILINVPSSAGMKEAATANYVAASLNRGAYFWSLGLRAFYFSFPLFLWILGAVPMFVCSVLLVLLLYFLDAMPPGGDFGDAEAPPHAKR